MFESESSRTLLTNPSNQEIICYPRRWLVLFIGGISVFLRTFNQSCFANINNVYVEYFQKAAWQIDWFVLAQSVAMKFSMLLFIIIAKKMNVRTALCYVTGLSFIAYLITAVGHLTRSGYSAVVVGQTIEGFSSTAAWSILILVPAVWFPSHQVAIAVGILVVCQGIGEAAGSIIPPYIVSMKSTPEQVKRNLFALFATLAVTSFIMFIMSFLFSSGPPTPPSAAEMKALDLRKREQSAPFGELMKSIATSLKIWFTSKNFRLIWFVIGASTTSLRANNVLLPSMLHKAFPDALKNNENVGVLLAVAWFLSTLGGFVTGPIIAKTHLYKEIALAGVLSMLVSSILLLIGVHCQIINVVYGAVLLQGFTQGMLLTSLLEFVTEVTYPENTMFVSMLLLSSVGLFRLIYSIGERMLLDNVSATAANLVPVVMLFVCLFFIFFAKKDYRRSLANNEQETESLISSMPNYGTQNIQE